MIKFFAPAQPWATISPEGRLTHFDEALCRIHSESNDTYAMWAKLCLLLIKSEWEKIAANSYGLPTFGKTIELYK